MDREDFGNLAAFAVIAEERSFTRAAARLGLSPSALSHAMRGLEERLRVRLLSRSTRSVSTTEAGERLLVTLRPALGDITLAVEELGRLLDQPAGRVRVTTTRQAATMFIAPVLPQFSIDYPDVIIELVIEEGLTDIVAKRFDAGVRLGESLAQDMISVRISKDQMPAVVAAPDYFKQHTIPVTPHDLRQHRSIGSLLSTAGTEYKWEFERDGRKLDVATNPHLLLNDTDLMIDAALAGAGITCVFEKQVAAYIESGALVRVLQDWCAPIPGYFLYYPSRRQTPASLRVFINALRLDP